ncbi:MAG: ASKHA domain-containing protein, partial [Acidobacteriota bacterium]
MKKTFTVKVLPFEDVHRVCAGKNLLEAVSEAGLPLKSTCGGQGICGDCLIRIISGRSRGRTSAVLRAELSRQGYALACQTEVEENLVIQLPDFEELSLPRAAEWSPAAFRKEAISGVVEVNPILRRITLNLPSATLDDNASDQRRLERGLKKELGIEGPAWAYPVLKKLAREAREEEGLLTAYLIKTGNNWTIVDVRSGRPKKRACGLAADIGTTTISCSLVDCESGETLASASGFNRQIKCGEDIISRINYAQRPGRLEELQELVIATVNALIDQALKSAGASSDEIYLASISGNTTMIHLFLGLEPRHIREEPYTPTISQASLLLGRDLNLRMNPEARVFYAPAVGSYVGGDITAGLLATPLLLSSKDVSLFIDAGTNGELVVGNRDWLVTCACSAGPAFEGSGTKCGMPAAEGAMEEIRFSD